MTFALPAVAGLKSRLVGEEEQGRSSAPSGEGYPPGNGCYSLRHRSHGPVEIVDKNPFNMMIFHSFLYVYQSISCGFAMTYRFYDVVLWCVLLGNQEIWALNQQKMEMHS